MKRLLYFSFLILTACSTAVTSTPASFFNLTPDSALSGDDPTSSSDPALPGPTPVVTESRTTSGEDAGELYFFLQPRQPGQSIQLAKVSDLCIVDPIKCPALEKINVPFAFKFTINAMSWSPDGKLAAFAYSDNPNGTPTKLWAFDPSTRNWKSLLEFPYIDPPFWSPDGAWIAFRAQDGAGNEGVYVVRRDGADLKQVSNNLPVEGRPYIMDGWYREDILMRSALSVGSGSRYLVSANDGTVKPLMTKAQFIASPDANFIVYDDHVAESQEHTIKVVGADHPDPITLASFTGGSIYPLIWSPNSQQAAFNYFRTISASEPKAEVYVANRDGSKLTMVYSGVTVGRLIFSPNGRYLLVEETTSVTGGHLFIVDLATFQNKILQAPGLSTDYDWYAPSWKP